MTIVHSRQSRISFDTSWLEDLYEQVVSETQANKILPLVINPGRVLLTTSRIYFQPYNNMDQVIIVLYYTILIFRQIAYMTTNILKTFIVNLFLIHLTHLRICYLFLYYIIYKIY